MANRKAQDAAALRALTLLDERAPASSVLAALSTARIPAPLSVAVHPRADLLIQVSNATSAAARSIELSHAEIPEQLAQPLAADSAFRALLTLKFQVLEGEQVRSSLTPRPHIDMRGQT